MFRPHPQRSTLAFPKFPPSNQQPATFTSNRSTMTTPASTDPSEPLLDPNGNEIRPPTLCEKLLACGCCLCFTPFVAACACLQLACACCCCCASGVDSAVHKAQGKRWDAVQHKWVIDNLVDDLKHVENLPKDDSDILKGAKADEEPEIKVEPEDSTVKVKDTECKLVCWLFSLLRWGYSQHSCIPLKIMMFWVCRLMQRTR